MYEGLFGMVTRYKNELIHKKIVIEKLNRFYYLLSHWVLLKQNNYNIADLLVSKGIRSVAIYGMKELGELICRELEGTEVKVLYTIDKNKDGIYTKYPLFSPDDSLEKTDAIIVTAIYEYPSIKEYLCKRVEYPVISLEDLVYEVD